MSNVDEVIEVNVPFEISGPLLSGATKEFWLTALSPLRWILYPIGIIPCFSNDRHAYPKNKCLRVWSYLYVLVLFTFPIIIFSPSLNWYTRRANESTSQLLVVIITNVILFLGILYLYWFLRFKIIGKEYLQSLWMQLYENIKQIEKQSAKDSILLKYRNYIHSCCKLYVVSLYALYFILSGFWLFVSYAQNVFYDYFSFVTLLQYLYPFLYDFEIWLPMFILLTFFIISIQILYLHFCIYSVQLYHTFDGNTLFSNHRIYVYDESQSLWHNISIYCRAWIGLNSINTANNSVDKVTEPFLSESRPDSGFISLGSSKHDDMNENEANKNYFSHFPDILTIFTYNYEFSELQCLNGEAFKDNIVLFNDFKQIKEKYFSLILLFSKYAQIWLIAFIWNLILFVESIAQGMLLLFMFEATQSLSDMSALIGFNLIVFAIFMGYIIVIAYVNQSCDNLKRLMSVINCEFGCNCRLRKDIDKNNSMLLKDNVTQTDILYFNNLVDMHPCVYTIWGIEITYNKALVVFLTGLSTVLTYVIDAIVSNL